ncbi:MAG TPA: hypothetical protein VGD59_00815 [Acidisarcina sp.]
MDTESYSLRQIFHDLVSECYAEHVGMRDSEVSSYVADLLTDFSKSDRLYRLRDGGGRPLDQVDAMLAASDPVHGTAPSFDTERQIRKHIGDYALFLTGMYPESVRREEESFFHLVQAGKESYYVVSQFNVFEYAAEAPLFGRLADSFESCIYGLQKVRGELERRKAISPALQRQKRLM